jgi:AcrR family transcriptional regulator
VVKRSKRRVPPGLQRPGGRTGQVREKVARAVLSMIRKGRLDFGYNELAIAAGVSKVTLYRRWPRRTDLLKEAIKEHYAELTLPRLKHWPDSAEAMMRRLAVFLGSPNELAMNLALLSDPTTEASALMRTQWEPVEQRLEQIVEDAKAKGELPPDIDSQAIVLMLMSPLLVMALLERKPIDRRRLGELIKIVRRMQFSQ